MDVEDYVPCVLASELDTTLYKPELANAFAIVIRTFAKNNNKRHKYYDFCDLTHCEVFKGSVETQLAASQGGRKPGDIWKDPANATKGMTLTGSCAKEAVYFSSCCGGVTG